MCLFPKSLQWFIIPQEFRRALSYHVVWTQRNKRSALHNFKKHVDFLSQIHHFLTLFGFAGMSVRLQSVAICAATAIRPVGVHAGLAAYPIHCTFIMICTQRKSHLWQIRYAQTWPKYIKPSIMWPCFVFCKGHVTSVHLSFCVPVSRGFTKENGTLPTAIYSLYVLYL